MAGQLKVGGNIIASHSGVEGAGTVNLQNVTLGDSSVVFPAGHVIQVVYNQKTDREALSTSSWTDIPGTDQDGNGSLFSASITPTSASNKIFVTVNLEGSGGEARYVFGVRLYRGVIPIGLSDQIGTTRPQTFMSSGQQNWENYGRNNLSNSFLDSPNSTSEQTYSLKVWDSRDNGTVYINRAYYDGDNTAVPTGTSSIILMEIQQ